MDIIEFERPADSSVCLENRISQIEIILPSFCLHHEY